MQVKFGFAVNMAARSPSWIFYSRNYLKNVKLTDMKFIPGTGIYNIQVKFDFQADIKLIMAAMLPSWGLVSAYYL